MNTLNNTYSLQLNNFWLVIFPKNFSFAVFNFRKSFGLGTEN